MTNVPEPAKGKSWRNVLPVHPAADLFPLMSPDELRELGEDIKKNGLRQRVMLWRGKLLDGRNRLDAMEAAGIPVWIKRTEGAPWINYEITRNGKRRTDVANEPWDIGDDPYAYILSANIHRRHLTAEQRRELIAKVIEAHPEKSDRQIAEMVKRDHKTVGSVRREQEDVGNIPHVEARTDTKGRKQPTKKKQRAKAHCEIETRDESGRVSRSGVSPEAAKRMLQDDGDDPGVVTSEEFKSNILDTIDRHKAWARAYKKVFKKVSEVWALDQTSKDEVSAAIDGLINTWQSLQRAVERQAPTATPIQEVEPEITTAVTYTATPARAPVEMPDMPEFLVRTA